LNNELEKTYQGDFLESREQLFNLLKESVQTMNTEFITGNYKKKYRGVSANGKLW
jgi:hypothetical protein